jgi:uncharacterized protein (DUF1330 family)
MTAYIVSRVNIHDPDSITSYFGDAPETVEAHGSKYLARTNDLTQFEGDEQIDRMVILEFPDTKSANAWYNSQEYRPLRDQRWAAADAKIIMIPGE